MTPPPPIKWPGHQENIFFSDSLIFTFFSRIVQKDINLLTGKLDRTFFDLNISIKVISMERGSAKLFTFSFLYIDQPIFSDNKRKA